MRRLQALAKLLHVLMHIVRGLWLIWRAFPGLTMEQQHRRTEQWARSLLALLGIELRVQGEPPPHGPVLLAANHISWLDIVVLLAAGHCRFVSKADVKHWPLIGMLATAAGTLYIERESRRDAMRVVHHMAERLQAGDVLAVFPEGTTSDGLSLLPFHANLFQAAIAAKAPVLPVALRFSDKASGQLSLAPCYIGDDSLLVSIWRTLKADPLCAELTFGNPQLARGRDRRTWAADLRLAVQALRGQAS